MQLDSLFLKFPGKIYIVGWSPARLITSWGKESLAANYPISAADHPHFHLLPAAKILFNNFFNIKGRIVKLCLQ